MNSKRTLKFNKKLSEFVYNSGQFFAFMDNF